MKLMLCIRWYIAAYNILAEGERVLQERSVRALADKATVVKPYLCEVDSNSFRIPQF